MEEKIIEAIEQQLNELPKAWRFKQRRDIFTVERFGRLGSGRPKWHKSATISVSAHTIKIVRPLDVTTKSMMEIVATKVEGIQFTIVEAEVSVNLAFNTKNFPNFEPCAP